MDKEYAVRPGARFAVVWRRTAKESESFEGVYRGMSAIGTETALVFDVDGTLRFLSASSVACMDQLEAAPDTDERKSDAGSVFYG